MNFIDLINPVSSLNSIDEFQKMTSVHKGITLVITVVATLLLVVPGIIAFRGLTYQFRKIELDAKTPLAHQAHKVQQHNPVKLSPQTMGQEATRVVTSPSPDLAFGNDWLKNTFPELASLEKAAPSTLPTHSPQGPSSPTTPIGDDRVRAAVPQPVPSDKAASITPPMHSSRGPSAPFKPVFILSFHSDYAQEAEEFEQLLKEYPWFKARASNSSNGNKILNPLDGKMFEIGYTPKEIEAFFGTKFTLFLFCGYRPGKSVFGSYHGGNRYQSSKGAICDRIADDPFVIDSALVGKGSGVDFPPINFSMQGKNSISEEDVIDNLLRNAKGICVSDSIHETRATKQFLIDHMHRLREGGVTTLFFEHLFRETQQEALDSESVDLPLDLELYVNHLDQSFGILKNIIPGFRDLVIAAKKAGIRIVALDTGRVYATSSEDEKRIKALNYLAVQIINKEISAQEKYIVFCGGAHVITMCAGVPGISQLMGIPNIFVEEREEAASAMTTNVITNISQHPHFPFLSGRVHALVYR